MSEQTAVTNRTPTASERFMQVTVKQFLSDVGKVEVNEYERTLLQHIYIRVDMTIAEYNVKQSANSQISWQNINMKKLAVDAVNRVKLGLDALIPGHLYAILYKSGKQEGMFDVDLRVGYKGEEFYTIRGSMFGLKHIYKRLVYGDEKLIVFPKGRNNPVESYELRLTDDPFNRGELRGGFAYLEYEDPELNELVVLSKADIEKRHKTAQSEKFWGPWYDEMALKTIIHAAAKKVTLDPEKVNATALVAADDEGDYADAMVNQYANDTAISLEVPVQNASLPQPQQAIELDAQPQEQPAPAPVQHAVDTAPAQQSFDDYYSQPAPTQQASGRKRPF